MASSPVVFLVSHSAAGGAQEIWVNLAEGFRRSGRQTTLMALYPHGDGRLQSSLSLDWTYLVPERPRSPLAVMRMVLALVRYMKRERPAVFSALPAANVVAALAGWAAGGGARVITSHHSPVHVYSRGLDLIDGFTGSLGSVKAVISVSRSVMCSQDAKPAAYRIKRLVIPNALPPDVEAQLAALASGKDRSRAGGRKVVAAGRLAPEKNYPVLIRAAPQMPDVQVDIIGGGPDEAALKALARDLGVEDRVRFLGFLPRAEALKRVAEADVFTQPSLFEGHSLALVEASKLGLPIVVSDVPVQIEGITDKDGRLCGMAVDAQDDLGLAKALSQLLDDAAVYQDFARRSADLARGSSFAAMVAAYESLAA